MKSVTYPTNPVKEWQDAARRQWDMDAAIQQAVAACRHPATQPLLAQLSAASRPSDFRDLHNACVDLGHDIAAPARGPYLSPRGSRAMTRDESIRYHEAGVVLAVCRDYADPRWPTLGGALKELAAAYAAPEPRIKPLEKRLADWDRQSGGI